MKKWLFLVFILFMLCLASVYSKGLKDNHMDDELFYDNVFPQHEPYNPNVENYLHEAGLVYDAPAGIVYQDGTGEPIVNLGVHEHWNNSVDKKYSRNLEREEGIELICLIM